MNLKKLDSIRKQGIITTFVVGLTAASSVNAGSLPGISCWGVDVGNTVKWTTNQLGKPDCEVVNVCNQRVQHAIYVEANPEHNQPKRCIALKATASCDHVGSYWKGAMADYRGQPTYDMTDY